MNKMDYLKNTKIKDYGDFTNKFEGYLTQKKIPIEFHKKIKYTPETTVLEFLHIIDKTLMDHYGDKRDTAKSFIDSRFSPIPDILKRGMVSCGALSRVHGAILRNVGIPVKLVHGRIKGQRGEDRHAWIKIYSPKFKKWISVDPTQDKKDFEILSSAYQIKIYKTWEEMRGDYVSGKF